MDEDDEGQNDEGNEERGYDSGMEELINSRHAGGSLAQGSAAVKIKNRITYRMNPL